MAVIYFRLLFCHRNRGLPRADIEMHTTLLTMWRESLDNIWLEKKTYLRLPATLFILSRVLEILRRIVYNIVYESLSGFPRLGRNLIRVACIYEPLNER